MAHGRCSVNRAIGDQFQPAARVKGRIGAVSHPRERSSQHASGSDEPTLPRERIYSFASPSTTVRTVTSKLTHYPAPVWRPSQWGGVASAEAGTWHGLVGARTAQTTESEVARRPMPRLMGGDVGISFGLSCRFAKNRKGEAS